MHRLSPGYLASCTMTPGNWRRCAPWVSTGAGSGFTLRRPRMTHDMWLNEFPFALLRACNDFEKGCPT